MRDPAISDAVWARILPLLPPEKPSVGRPNIPHRAIVAAIWYIITTGEHWAHLPGEYPSYKTCFSRYTRWQQSGLWARIEALLREGA